MPLFGVLFLDWNVATVLFTYWVESGIVGLLNVPKMLLVAGGQSEPVNPFAAIGLTAFFAVHYGGFWIIHGFFLLFLTGATFFGARDPVSYVLADPPILLVGALLFISHAVSLLVNFIGRREFRSVSMGTQMFAPYPRVFVLHVTIVLGGFAIVAMGEPQLLAALLVALKTLFDLALHLREHERRGATGAPPSAAAAP